MSVCVCMCVCVCVCVWEECVSEDERCVSWMAVSVCDINVM